MRDPYTVLGIRQNADQEEIRAAWRALASAVHPDRNPDDPLATVRFTEAGRAYELLRDPDRRSRYDRDTREAERRHMEALRRRQAERKAQAESAEEVIARIFGVEPTDAPGEPQQQETRAAPAAAEPARGENAAPAFLAALLRRLRGSAPADKAPDLACEAVVEVADILARRRIAVTAPDGRTLRVALGPGSTEGQVIRLPGQGHRIDGLKQGDAIVTLRLAPGRFRAEGCDLRTELAVSIENAVLGCETEIEGPLGTLDVTVPAWSGSDQVLRIEGEGLIREDGTRGDLLVEIRLLLWERPDDKMVDLMRSLRDGLYL